ncbi:ER membrane protein complex subunit 7 homolog [Onthophagus taurus]|uniref:ER membrane protein complex subunit 7 homolog n=1 Tax=Onthophagus taurus TaxID=166361 RepID=UPI000C20B164|nr:ER membrane protein complex subunit 7 homolog [Onthophagus taurus]
MSKKRNFLLIFLIIPLIAYTKADLNDQSQENDDKERYIIEGKVYPFDAPFSQQNWQANTKIQLNGGEYLGFVKEDGSFIVHNIPSGSFILEVINPELSYEPVRVEINSKGKYRARKVNHIQTAQIIQVPYPLRLKPLGKTKYFQIREQWRVTDFIFNPMVLMMVLPLILVMVLPKMMNDPETKKEMENLGSLTKFPDVSVSDFVTNWFTGNPPNQQQQQQGNKKIKAKRAVQRQ